MVFVYTGVFSEYNIIIHYNSVKILGTIFLNIGIGDFADDDVPMLQHAPMLSMFDVRCAHRPNSNINTDYCILSCIFIRIRC